MGLPGSQRSLEKLVDEHYSSLYRYAYRLSGNSADAEDLTQETFCKAQACYSQLRDPDNARPWLFRILRNDYIHHLKTTRLESAVSLDEIADPAECPSEGLPEIDPKQLQNVLQDLPEHFRTPIILYYFEDFSYREIAEQMELAIGTVMSRLARAKSYVRSRLQEKFSPTRESGNRARRASNGV